LLRHGESTWNVAKRWQGHGDPGLTPNGRDQAREAGKGFAGAQIQHIVTSDLRRARETAAIVGEVLGITPEADADWRERDIGTWTGLTRAQIAERWPKEYAHFLSHDASARPGGGESDAMLRERAEAALARLRARAAGERVLVVTHRGIARILTGVALHNGEATVVSQ
jgi:broad specificity phosphatase PhoE